MNPINSIIKKLNLERHVEGGYYRRTYQSSQDLYLSKGTRSINTAIYYLLESHDFSCWHRLKSDEIWHYYCGNDIGLYQIHPDGTLTSIILGNMLENPNAIPQHIIPANTWFAAQVIAPNSFTLLGCSVAPGFDFADFEMGDRQILTEQYPQHRGIIAQLTRE